MFLLAFMMVLTGIIKSGISQYINNEPV